MQSLISDAIAATARTSPKLNLRNPARAPAASRKGVAGTGKPICSASTAAIKTIYPCMTRNSIGCVVGIGSLALYSIGSGQQMVTGGLMIRCLLLAVRHAVIEGHLRLVKRCGERISRYAAHDGRHDQAKRRGNIAAQCDGFQLRVHPPIALLQACNAG